MTGRFKNVRHCSCRAEDAVTDRTLEATSQTNTVQFCYYMYTKHILVTLKKTILPVV